MSPIVKRLLLGAGALALLVLLAYPKLPAFDGEADEEAPDGEAADSRLLVDAHVVEPALLQDRIRTTGSIRASEEVDLRSEISGMITEIHFEEGRPVEEGQLLLKINDRELQAELRQVRSRYELAEGRERRQEQLLEEGGISREEYESTQNEVSVLEAEMELLEAQIEKTELRAPFDGVIGLRHVSRGSYIAPDTRVASLQALDPVRVEFSVPERYARQVEVGSLISFTVEGGEDTFEGEIYAYDPHIQEGTRSLQLRALSPNSELALLPGGFASIELILEEYDEALVVPSIAVMPDLEGRRVFVYQDGEAQPRTVQTGIRTAENVQILEGIAPYDTVLTTGLQRLRPGQPVRLAETTEGLIPEEPEEVSVEEDMVPSEGGVE